MSIKHNRVRQGERNYLQSSSILHPHALKALAVLVERSVVGIVRIIFLTENHGR